MMHRPSTLEKLSFAWTKPEVAAMIEAVPIIETAVARIHCIAEGHGPPVLLLQGAGVVGEAWRPQFDALRHRYTMVTLDNRGVGGTPLPPGPLSVEAMTGDAVAVMDALGFERFHLGGHSMGGLVAQEIALRAPARVASLALLCTFAHGRQAARLAPAMLLMGLRTRLGTRAMRRNAFCELVMPASYLRQADRAALAERLRPLFGHDLAEQPSIALKQVRAMARYDAGARLAQLGTIPTLVLSASEDRIARPAFGRELASLIPNARYVEVPDAGHGVTIQCADVVNALLEYHWSRADDRSLVPSSLRPGSLVRVP